MKNNRLEVSDIVVVNTVLGGARKYPVISIEKNKAHTRFRDFNTQIYPGGFVYEFGKNPNQTINSYTVYKP